jgi:hypothetical protein
MMRDEYRIRTAYWPVRQRSCNCSMSVCMVRPPLPITLIGDVFCFAIMIGKTMLSPAFNKMEAGMNLNHE